MNEPLAYKPEMEIVRDYFERYYSYIARARAKRPQDFSVSEPAQEHPQHCVFCPGNEAQTPPEIGRVANEAGAWSIRWFANKFSAVSPDVLEAYGHQEVIVETPAKDRQLWDLSLDELQILASVYQQRVAELSKDPNIASIAVFKNAGIASGASLAHSHTQIIASDKKFSSFTPIEAYAQRFQGCPYCQVLAQESASERVVAQNDDFIALCPRAPRFACEVWIVVKRHEVEFLQFSSETLRNLMALLSLILARLKSINAPYCFYITYTKEQQPHFHLELLPRLHVWGGFELASGDYIIGVPPIQAAQFYQQQEKQM